MTFDEYSRIEAINISSLLQLARSPRHYQHARRSPGRDTPALAFGRLAHAAILEPHRYEKEAAVWQGGVRRGKEYAAWKESVRDRIQVSIDEHLACMAMAAAVSAHASAASLFSPSGQAEHTILWTHPVGLACKSRLDWVDTTADVVVDLKTCRDACAVPFGRSAATYRYHTRAAFYADAYRAQYGRQPVFYLVAVEKDAPHGVAVYRVPEHFIDIGRREYEALLARLALCLSTDRWPGVQDDAIGELLMPDWVTAGDDGLDLVVDGEAFRV